MLKLILKMMNIFDYSILLIKDQTDILIFELFANLYLKHNLNLSAK